MAQDKTNILIIGANRAAAALINMFKDDPSIHIAGVVDKDQKASGVKLAKQSKIPVDENWDKLIQSKALDEIVNVTGSEETHRLLLKDKPDKTVLVGGATAKALCFLAQEYETAQEKIQKALDEAEAAEWGAQKTNEGIKALYAELEEKNKELQELDRLKSDFISTVSHELRTPLAITKEGITLIQDGILGHVNEKQTKVLTTAKDSIDRLARLISSLLDISKIEAGSTEISKSLINANKLVEQSVSLFESKANDNGLELRMGLPEKDVEIFADHDKIVQVLTNLINNSIKFTEKGYISVSVAQKEDGVEFCVEDTGQGVEKASIPKMFVKFQQINRVHGDGEKGTGLGLSIAKSIVEIHDGRIWAESEVGKGTKVFFTIPRYDEAKLLREYVNKGVEEAVKNKSKLSLMAVTIDNIEKVKEVFSDEKIYSVLKGVEGVLKDSLNYSGGAALKDSYECIVVLPDSNKQSVLSAEGRLKQAVDDYLMREKLTDKITLKFGCATYPDEASNGEELIKQALKGR